jgi:hypothetical protein
MHLSDFSSPSHKSQAYLRSSEAEDELYCPLCQKMYKINDFKSHIDIHKRKQGSKLPTV